MFPELLGGSSAAPVVVHAVAADEKHGLFAVHLLGVEKTHCPEGVFQSVCASVVAVVGQEEKEPGVARVIAGVLGLPEQGLEHYLSRRIGVEVGVAVAEIVVHADVEQQLEPRVAVQLNVTAAKGDLP